MLRRCTLLILLFLLAACSPSSPTSTPTSAESATPRPSATATAASSSTPTASATYTLTPTRTLTFTPSPSPTPLAALDQAEVIQINDGIGGIGLVLKIPHLSTPYNLILGGTRFDCKLDAQYPDWLFCWGLTRPTLDIPLTQALLDPLTNQVVLERKVVLSSAVLPTALPEGYGFTNCPDRGKNISCETECRLDWDGNPCIVATCTDACGLYRSVHSCPQDMPLPAKVCNAEQWVEAKAKHGIP
jgi:hypothetical protein